MDFKDQVKETYEKVAEKTKNFIETTKEKIKSGELQEEIKTVAGKVKDTVVEKIKEFKKNK